MGSETRTSRPRRAGSWTIAMALAVSSSVAGASEDSAFLPAAPAYYARAWSRANGLPQESINEILQTPSGELWLATYGGLLRFDGVRFQTFDLETLPSLSSHRFTSLAADDSGGIWIATQDHHLVHLRGHEIVENADYPNDEEEFVSVHVDDGGHAWVRGNSGALYRRESGDWTRLIAKGDTTSYESVCHGPDDRMLAADGEFVRAFDRAGARVGEWKAPERVLALAPARDGSTWIGLEHGLARLAGDRIERIEIEEERGARFDARVLAILDDSRGDTSTTLWLGTASGPRLAIRADPTHPWSLQPPFPGVPPTFDVRAFLRDREDNVWVGSASVGLLRLSPRRIEIFSPPPPDRDVTALAIDAAGGMWLVGHQFRLGFLRADATHADEFVLPDGSDFGGDIYSLLCDTRARLWAGFKERIGRLEGHDFVNLAGAPLFPTEVVALVADADGGAWAASDDGEVVHFDASDRELERFTISKPIASLALGIDGELWIGTRNGVVIRHTQSGDERIQGEHGMPPGIVRHMLVEPGGALWISTYGGGLARWKDGRVQRLTREQGMPDNSLSWSLDDGQGRLWILANLGLIVVQRDELEATLAGRRTRIDPIVIGPEAGMPEGNAGSPAGLVDASGRMCFATTEGAVRLDPRAFPFNRVPPPVQVDRVLADDDELVPPFRVPAGTRRLTIEYTAFALTDPGRVHFKSRLEGFDEAPNEVGTQRSASYTTLWPGRYTFEVEARNENGVWSTEPASIVLEVLPSWWQTTTFAVLVVLAAIAVFFAFDRWRVRVVGRRSRERLEMSEARAVAEEHASRLRDQLAHAARVATAGELATSLAHEVNQPLAAIVTNAQAGQRLLASTPANVAELRAILVDIAGEGHRASEVIRRLRDFLRKHAVEWRHVDVNDVVRDTLPLVRRELEDHRVRPEIDLHESLPLVAADAVQIQQVVVNLVKNACEALSASPGDRCVTVCTRARGEHVELEVSDNGPGIAPALAGRLFEPFTSTKSSGMGLGLAICRSIVEAHGGHLRCDQDRPRGASFVVQLPSLALRGGAS